MGSGPRAGNSLSLVIPARDVHRPRRSPSGSAPIGKLCLMRSPGMVNQAKPSWRPAIGDARRTNGGDPRVGAAVGRNGL